VGWSAQRRTGLTVHSSARSFKGLTLLTPLGGEATLLLDMDGRVVHRWRQPGYRVFHAELLPSGNLLALVTDTALLPAPETPFDQPPPVFDRHVRRLGGNASHLRELDWDSRLVWEYRNERLHHDFVRLDNGNTLVAEWAELPAELAERVVGGVRRPGEVFPPMLGDDILEIDIHGVEVQRIRLWQLLDPVDDPICPLETRWEWTHVNSLALTADGGLVFSSRTNSRIGIIDRPDGTLRWKFGWPELAHQHHATVLANGTVQVFDNGMHRLGLPYSRVVEIDPGYNRVVWEYTGEPREQFFSGHISGAQRLPNRNVLICEGTSGRVFEVTPRGETVWEWINPFLTMNRGNQGPWIFRALRYGADFPGLIGHSLDPAQLADFNRLHGL
jgi:hypothetical protein